MGESCAVPVHPESVQTRSEFPITGSRKCAAVSSTILTS